MADEMYDLHSCPQRGRKMNALSAARTTLAGIPRAHRIVPARTSAITPAKRRIHYLDGARGLLFIFMTSTHAMTLAEIPRQGLLHSRWWLPQG
jgi:hypothetical protein